MTTKAANKVFCGTCYAKNGTYVRLGSMVGRTFRHDCPRTGHDYTVVGGTVSISCAVCREVTVMNLDQPS